MVTNFLVLKEGNVAGEMAQQVNAFASKPGDLSSIPGTHKVEGEN